MGFPAIQLLLLEHVTFFSGVEAAIREELGRELSLLESAPLLDVIELSSILL